MHGYCTNAITGCEVVFFLLIVYFIRTYLSLKYLSMYLHPEESEVF